MHDVSSRSAWAFSCLLALPSHEDHGVLSLIVPKPERLKPKSIAIGAGQEQRQLDSVNA